MRRLALLSEELESRPDEPDRIAAIARFLRAVGRESGMRASEWLVQSTAGRPARRPTRVLLPALCEAAQALAAAAGTPPWLFAAGRAAEREAAEAIALLLPWPDGPWRPGLDEWLAAWHEAAMRSAPEARPRAVAQMIARLDDAFARRWAVRAVCGLVRPVVREAAWLRAWSAAFGQDFHELTWRWQAHGRQHALAAPADAPDVPRPQAFAPALELEAPVDAALLDALAAGELWLEPQWAGLRVQVVRRGAALAVWLHDGVLLNARLSEGWLVPDAWPEPCVIEGVLVGWQGGRVVSPWLAATGPRPARGEPGSASLHLVLTDWHRWADDDAGGWTTHERRARLEDRWPVDVPGVAMPSTVFTTPTLPLDLGAAASAQAMLATLAEFHQAEGGGAWSGLLLRRRAARGAEHGASTWVLRPAPRRVRAVLQYAGTDAFAASASAASALAFVPCGFALWNRAPRSEAERDAAMRASMDGELAVPDEDARSDDALRLLPLARLPLALPEAQLRSLHAWLREHSGQRFGKVVAVAPVLVFEIGYAQLRASGRHRLGAVLEDARVLRWVTDAAPGAAANASELFGLGGGGGAAGHGPA